MCCGCGVERFGTEEVGGSFCYSSSFSKSISLSLSRSLTDSISISLAFLSLSLSRSLCLSVDRARPSPLMHETLNLKGVVSARISHLLAMAF